MQDGNEVWLGPHRVRAPAGARIRKKEKNQNKGLFVLQEQNTGLSGFFFNLDIFIVFLI